MQDPFIFLDIDGVLNGHHQHANKYCGVDYGCMELLNQLLDDTGAKIVVASAWRYFVLRGEMTVQGFAGMMYTHGLKWGSVVDVLGPDNREGDRGVLVQDWITARYCRSHRARIVAIDDMDLGYIRAGVPLVQTNSLLGLTAELMQVAKDTLLHPANS